MFKNKNLINIAKIFLAGFIFFVLVKSSQLNLGLFQNLLHNPAWTLLAILIFIVMVFLGSYRWYLLNNAQALHMGFRETVKSSYIGAAFNALLPGSVGGDFVRCYNVFKLFPERKSSVLMTVFMDRVIGLLGVLATLCLVAVTHFSLFSQQKELFYLLVASVCACCALFAVFFALMFFPQKLGLQAWIEKKFPHNKYAALIVKYLNTFCSYRIPKMTLAKCLVISVTVQYLLITAMIVIGHALNLPMMAFAHYAIASGITLLIILVPITPGGVGLGEMAFANILLLLNPGSTLAFATIYLGYRFLSMLTYLPAVIFYLPKFNLLQRKQLEME